MSAVVQSIGGRPDLRIARLIRLLVARQRMAVAYVHQPEPFETAFADLACAHPERCSCPADYPGWKPGGSS